LWAKQLGGIGAGVLPFDVAIDTSGNVYAVGQFSGTADFDPGPGVFSLTAVSAVDVDVWISKLDANGNFIWAKDVGGADASFYGSGAGSTFREVSIALDTSGNVHVGGG